MSLEPGSTIASYTITREVGRGGMGVVYLAKDTRLDRDVAIKALPEELAADPARLERFEREARTLASLNHPNLAGIYGIEEQSGARYLVLEYVEGETIADILDRGPLPVDDALELAVQICAGIEAAHEAGVIHRDLKPANIKVTPEGKAKVLDFGLARADEGNTSASSIGLSNSPTVTSPVQHSPTIPGAILGTAPYMSPEQARGRKVDKRTDIWSFAVVLYEMLTGIGPFHGETATDSIGAILHKDVDLSLLPANTPSTVRRILTRCLARDKAQRYRDIADVRIELQSAGSAHSADIAPTRAPNKLLLPLAVLVALLAAVGGWFLKPAPPEAEKIVRKYDVFVETDDLKLGYQRPKISPDGSRVAYIADDAIHVRDLDSFESREIPNSKRVISTFWSPDSKWLGYFTESAVIKTSITDGGTIQLAQVTDLGGVSGGAWLPDDRIIYGTNTGLKLVSARGGTVTDYLKTDEETDIDFHHPTVMRGTNTVLYCQHLRAGTFALQAYDGKDRMTIPITGDEPIQFAYYSPTGHILFSRGWSNQSLWAIAFNPRTLESSGDPFLVMNEAGLPSVSDNGTLLIKRGKAQFGGQLVLVDRDAKLTPIAEPRDLIFAPLLSNDSNKVAFTTGASPDKGDIWIHDRTRGTNTRVTFEETFMLPISWSPDDSELAVVAFTPSGENSVTSLFISPDGSGQSREPVDMAYIGFDAQWTMALSSQGPMASDSHFQAIPLDDPENGTTVFKSDTRINFPELSPDGSLMAYASSESGDSQIYCTRFPEGTGKWQVSTEGGWSPKWSKDSKTLFYQYEDALFEVSVDHEPAIQFGIPSEVLNLKAHDLEVAMNMSTTDDAQQFLMVKHDTDDEKPGAISVIENWYEQFREQHSR